MSSIRRLNSICEQSVITDADYRRINQALKAHVYELFIKPPEFTTRVERDSLYDTPAYYIKYKQDSVIELRASGLPTLEFDGVDWKFFYIDSFGRLLTFRSPYYEKQVETAPEMQGNFQDDLTWERNEEEYADKFSRMLARKLSSVRTLNLGDESPENTFEITDKGFQGVYAEYIPDKNDFSFKAKVVFEYYPHAVDFPLNVKMSRELRRSLLSQVGYFGR